MEIKFTRVEQALYNKLKSAAGEAVSTDGLMSEVDSVRRISYTTAESNVPNLIAAHIKNIRTKIKRNGMKNVIVTIRGYGYKMV